MRVCCEVQPRCEVQPHCVTSYPLCLEQVPALIVARTVKLHRMRNSMYLHVLSEDISGSVSLLSKVCVRVISGENGRVELYNISAGCAHIITDVCYCSFKKLAIVTANVCLLEVEVKYSKQCYFHSHPVRISAGRTLSLAPNPSPVSERLPLSPFFPLSSSSSSESPLTVKAVGMKYYLDVSALLTLSVDMTELSYPPYSLRLDRSQTHRARLSYEIDLSPSEGEDAVITITAIETLGGGSYSPLVDEEGKELINTDKGTRIAGSFLLLPLCSDVGLHIFTPYGFSADIGQDPATSLAHFRMLEVEYINT